MRAESPPDAGGALALSLPFLAAERVRAEAAAAGDPLPEAPLVLVARMAGAMRISALDAAAEAAGLKAGQELAAARAAVPGLEAVAHDAAADARWLERLARECRALAATVAVVAPAGLAIAPATAAAAVQERIAAHGLTARAEPVASLAAALARLERRMPKPPKLAKPPRPPASKPTPPPPAPQPQLALTEGLAPAPQHGPAAEPGARPRLLLDPPQPVAVLAAGADGPPQRFRWRRRLHELRRSEGPDRAGSRDYYRVEDACGRRLWLFREAAGEAGSGARGRPRWFVHGVFA